VKENGIRSLGELQWIVGVLIALRIEDGNQWWELPTVSRDGGGGPVSNGGRVRGNWMEGKCANARTCSRGAREGARGPQEEVIGASRSWRRRRAWQPRRSSGKSNATWRTRSKTAQDRKGGGEAVSGTWARGVAQDCTAVAYAAVMVRCVALVAGGSRGGSGWRGMAGKVGARAGSGGASEEAARGSDQGSAEAAGRRTWPGGGGGMRQRRNRGEGERGRRRRI
jgi:hypothetical protein